MLRSAGGGGVVGAKPQAASSPGENLGLAVDGIVTTPSDTRGATLKYLRINAGLSIRQLAKEVGLDESVVRGYEHDEYIPRPDHAKKVADRLGVSVTSIRPPEVF